MDEQQKQQKQQLIDLLHQAIFYTAFLKGKDTEALMDATAKVLWPSEEFSSERERKDFYERLDREVDAEEWLVTEQPKSVIEGDFQEAIKRARILAEKAGNPAVVALIDRGAGPKFEPDAPTKALIKALTEGRAVIAGSTTSADGTPKKQLTVEFKEPASRTKTPPIREILKSGGFPTEPVLRFGKKKKKENGLSA